MANDVAAFPGVAELVELKGPYEGDVFIRHASIGITPIWYFFGPDNMWYWTPYDHFIAWIPVTELRCTAGIWKGAKPATQNINIINYLKNNTPIPPALLRWQNYAKECRITVMCCSHANLGKHSPLNVLPEFILQLIAEYATWKPRAPLPAKKPIIPGEKQRHCYCTRS
ncbi:hypothetical protein Pelo_17957 [Pelomyxa schiedti]|nr:hypothetical protein Pelo_17957 [Pelomyxa schiedti]